MVRSFLMVTACVAYFSVGLGCSSKAGDDGGGSGGSSGSSGANQLVDQRDGKKYGTKDFGGEIWMTENLAFGQEYRPGVVLEAGAIKRWCPQTYPDPSTPSPCDLYGGYYTWATAMALPATCDSQDCSSQVQSPHQGICPTGFHVPSKQEFQALGDFLATETGLSAVDDKGKFTQLGAALRVNSACTTPGTEAPSVGFNGMPSGYANDTGYVSADGAWTYWQTTTEDAGYSYGWGIACADDRFGEGFFYKDNAVPLRCVKD